MSDKQNINGDILKAWQDYLQGAFQDPKMSELMLSHYNKFQDFLRATNNEDRKSNPDDDTRASSDVDVQYNGVAKRLDALEARLSNIEKLIASSNK